MDSDTPRTDAVYLYHFTDPGDHYRLIQDHAKQLERELAASQEQLVGAKWRADEIQEHYNRVCADLAASQRRVEELSAAHAKRLIEIGEMGLRVEELEKALRIIEFQGGDVMERWAAGIARAALSQKADK